VAHYYACEFGLNRLRIDGDIRCNGQVGNCSVTITGKRVTVSTTSMLIVQVVLASSRGRCLKQCSICQGRSLTGKHRRCEDRGRLEGPGERRELPPAGSGTEPGPQTHF